MIVFDHPQALWLLVPWALFCLVFGRLQTRALAWVERRVAPRHRRRFTGHRRRSLLVHLGLVTLAGALLLLAAAGPALPGGAAARGPGSVLLVIDASASMYAGDVTLTGADSEPLKSRLEVARWIASGLAEELEGHRFALVTFSGSAAIHLPMIRDRALLAEAVDTLEGHTFYRGSGSSFGAALDAVSHFIDPARADLQVVLLSDGETTVVEEVDEPLTALARQGIPLHAVAIGSEEGQRRKILDFRDVVAKAEEPRVLRRFLTKRVDEHLARMARRTGGHFEVADGNTIAAVAEAVRGYVPGRGRGPRDDRLRRPVGWLPLALFLVLFVADALWAGRRAPAGPPRFDLDRIAGPPSRSAGGAAPAALLLALVLGSCAADDAGLAHRENERGIVLDLVGRHDAARPHYQRAIGFGVEAQIPTYNLARSVTLAGDYSAAHELYQQALELVPELAEAHYNDGIALYRWGAAERDPANCDLERTHDLWSQARRRFTTAALAAEPGSDLQGRVQANLRALGRQLAEVERLR
ncbi:MAG: VWA domain-containing protein, partial [Thermoanaerobaculia bacterium]|nr:VWA domain-containing protein [Thermoanaerobaculia bacterium]